MSVEARLTLCNLSVELGARCGIIAPDNVTFAYLRGRRFAPQGELFDQAQLQWQHLYSDRDSRFDRDAIVNIGDVPPTVTWGVTPEHTVAIGGRVPDTATVVNPDERAALAAALDYMGLEPGQLIAGTKVDWVFIGSCTNSRISDLRAAASLIKGRHIAPGVTAWVVPGSVGVKREAEGEGLDRVFEAAGFKWREPGCSMCVAANGERVPPGARAVSTSNRNFIGRQGPGARTHLASPAMAVAAALTGEIFDVRQL